MSTHFKWYPAESEVVVPWNARYSFPSQVSPFAASLIDLQVQRKF